MHAPAELVVAVTLGVVGTQALRQVMAAVSQLITQAVDVEVDGSNCGRGAG